MINIEKHTDIKWLSKVANLHFSQEWYETMDEKHFWLEWRFRSFYRQWTDLDLSLDPCGTRILEVGGGHGMLRQQIEKRFGIGVDLTDLNAGALRMSPPSLGQTFYYDILENRSEMRHCYDIIFLYDVLEHIEETEPFVRSLNWHLKMGGMLIVNVPALQCFYSAFDKILGHCRRYSREELKSHVCPLGFVVKDVRYWGMTMLPFLVARWIFMSRMPVSEKNQCALARTGVTPPNFITNKIFNLCMSLEGKIFPRPPIGTSIMAVFEKHSEIS